MLRKVSLSSNQELWNARHVIGYWPQDWQTFYDNWMKTKPILGEIDEDDQWLYDISKELERCRMVKKRGFFWVLTNTDVSILGILFVVTVPLLVVLLVNLLEKLMYFLIRLIHW